MYVLYSYHKCYLDSILCAQRCVSGVFRQTALTLPDWAAAGV